jgi:hypothetical protein
MSRDVGVGQLVQELERRGDRLPFEIGAFVALEACEGLLQQSVKLDADLVRVTAEGSVVVAESAESTDPKEAARSLVSVLARLLVAAGPGVPPYLLDLVNESASGQSPRDLRHLHDAIEASLIPINRGASRRVLARLVRESDRPPAAEVPQVDPRELDAELDELLRDPVSRSLEAPRTPVPEVDEPVTARIRIPRAPAPDRDTGEGTQTAFASFPPPVPDLDTQPDTLPVPPSEPALGCASKRIPRLDAPLTPSPIATAAQLEEPLRNRGPEPITATIRKWQPSEPPEAESTTELSSATDEASSSVSVSESVTVTAPEPELETPTESVFGLGSVSASESLPPPQGLVGSVPPAAPQYDRPSVAEPRLPARRGGWAAWVLAALFGVGVYAIISTGAVDAWLAPAPPPAVGSTDGVIEVSVTPADAQVFVFVGRGPAVASGLPVDAAHEFIVFDRGLKPSRAVVPKGASWAKSERGSLYELAVQAEPAGPSATLDFGAPQSVPASAGAEGSGTIRIITNPQGAKVYRFVGIGPTIQILAPSIHEGYEILVYHPQHETRREVIGPSDWLSAEGHHSAKLDLQLPERAGSAVLEAPED